MGRLDIRSSGTFSGRSIKRGLAAIHSCPSLKGKNKKLKGHRIDECTLADSGTAMNGHHKGPGGKNHGANKQQREEANEKTEREQMTSKEECNQASEEEEEQASEKEGERAREKEGERASEKAEGEQTNEEC
ncbi:hypothetical protein H2248_001976 [Termitomyces sp. 'cryptogamus']|nr:hypothetical protein H2248_001976 [Termitomyces sp. 'cryptogamus']